MGKSPVTVRRPGGTKATFYCHETDSPTCCSKELTRRNMSHKAQVRYRDDHASYINKGTQSVKPTAEVYRLNE